MVALILTSIRNKKASASYTDYRRRFHASNTELFVGYGRSLKDLGIKVPAAMFNGGIGLSPLWQQNVVK